MADAPRWASTRPASGAVTISDTPPTSRRQHFGAAGHRFEQHVGPTFARRGEHQQIGGAVQLGERGVRSLAEEPDTVGDAELPRRCLQRGAFGPFADDHQRHVRQISQRLDHQAVALALDQVADGDQRRPNEAELLARPGAVHRVEHRQVDAVAHHPHMRVRHTERDEGILERLRNGDDPCGFRRRPQDHAPRQGEAADDVDVAAARGDHDGAIEMAAQHRGRDSIRIEIVGIDQIEVEPIGNGAPYCPHCPGVHEGGRHRHAELGNHGIARMIDQQIRAPLLARCFGLRAIARHDAAQPRRYPRYGSDHAQLDTARCGEVAQPVLDEDAVARRCGVGKERGEGQHLHAATPRPSGQISANNARYAANMRDWG